MSGLNIKQTDKSEKKDEPVETTEVPSVSYTSHPMENYAIGRFAFKKGLLTVTGDDVEIFERLHASLPEMEKHRIKKLDVGAAEAFVRDLLANQQPAATQVTDSSTGERARPVIGTGKLEDSNPPAENTGE